MKRVRLRRSSIGSAHASPGAPRRAIFALLAVLMAASAAAVSAPVFAAPRPSGEGRIIYLQNDGVTVSSVRPDGSDQHPLWAIEKPPAETVRELTADPTGRYLVYRVGEQLYVVYAGNATALGALRSPRWSPDGLRFAATFSGKGPDAGRVYVYDLRTSSARLLPITGDPDWFPRGDALVTAQHGNVYRFDLASGTAVQLTHLETRGDNPWATSTAHVLPDDKRIVFYGGRRKVVDASGNGARWWWIPATGGDPRPWSDRAGTDNPFWAASPDGRLLAYVNSAHRSACQNEQSVFASTPDGPLVGSARPPEPDPRTGDPVEYDGLSWAPDSGAVAFSFSRYRCVEMRRQTTKEPEIVLWHAAAAVAGEKTTVEDLVPGAYPTWISG